MLREWIPAKHILGMVYYLLYVLMFSLLIFHISLMVEPARGEYYSGQGFYWMICLVVAGVIGLKTVAILLLAKLFKTKTNAQLPQQSIFIFIGRRNLFSGRITCPCLRPGRHRHWGKFRFGGYIYDLQINKEFFSALPERTYGLLYLFLYLCALEIMPLLLLAKTIISFGEGMLRVWCRSD